MDPTTTNKQRPHASSQTRHASKPHPRINSQRHHPKHLRPSAADMPTGIRGIAPRTWRGRILALAAVIILIGIILLDISVARESIPDENYYSNPAQEFGADVIDRIADVVIASTPDSANETINRLREKLTGRSRWANTVIDAEQYWGLDTSATYLILSIIEVESGGDEDVDSVGNIMQIEPVTSYYSDYILEGVPEAGVEACTATASIYAGTKIVQDALEYYQGNFNAACDLNIHAQAAVVAQGYNYGYPGWLDYCARYGVTEWSYWYSSNYQASVMQGGGDSEYGQKIIDHLDVIDAN